jgi:ribokinase
VVSERGDNSILVAPGANLNVTPGYLDANMSILKNAGMVLTQLEIPLETVEYLAQICAREEVPLILDPAPAIDLSRNVFEHATWFTPNQTEALFYIADRPGDATRMTSAETAEAFLSKGCRGVVLKMGANGVYLRSQGVAGTHVPAFAVEAVDTTAAGDAFNAGFATGLMLGQSPQESASFASAVAALAVTRNGAQSSMPTMAEVQAFMQS